MPLMRLRPLTGLLLSLSLAAVACGGGGNSTTGSGGSSSTGGGGAATSTASVTSASTAASTGSGTGGGTGGGAPAPTYCAPSTVEEMPAGPAAFTMRTDHYELYAELPAAEAREMARVLEAAYSAFTAYF